MNTSIQTRCVDTTHTSAVSDDEEEEPVPVNSALLSGIPTSVPLPDVLTNSGSPGTTNAGTANADLGQSGTTVGMTAGLEPLRWMKAMLSSMSNPNAGGIPNEQEDNGYTTDEALGITYTDESTQLNVLELNPDTLPAAILSMARSCIYDLLLLLTTATLDHIMLNQSVRYRKVACGRGAGKCIVDESYFPAEESLQENNFWKAYKNWIALMEAVSGPAVIEGWHAHHNRMISDQRFSRWFPAWHTHNRLIRLKFTDKYFIIDPKAIAYIQQFKRCRTDLLRDLPSTFSLSMTPNTSLAPTQCGPLPSWQPGVALRYVPYDKPMSPAPSFHSTDILCVHCGRIGH